MPSSPSKRSSREETRDDPHMMDHRSSSKEPPVKRRRVFLQTMGHQLRDIGMMQGRPSEHDATLADSPGNSSNAHPVPGTLGGHAQVSIQTPESDVVPGEEDAMRPGATMSAAKALWQLNDEVSVTTDVADGGNSFTFDDLLAWTRSYFDYWHPAYPFLHAPSVLETFEQIVSDGAAGTTTLSTQQMVILKSIMSISLADRRQVETSMRPVPQRFVYSCFNEAINSVQCFLTEESSILSLQAVVSVELFLLSMLRYNAASRLAGLAVRMAFHLGLHRCPVQYAIFSAHEAELRQRIFWSIYCMDRYICIRLGVPLSIRDADINVCFPGSERHANEATESSDVDGRLELLRHLARLAEIRGSIMELRNKFVNYRQTDSDDVVVIDADLSKWWNRVDEYLESNNTNTFPISEHHQVALTVLRHESVIALNKHVLATSNKSSAYAAALQNCIGAARSIVGTLHKALVANGNSRHSADQQSLEIMGLLWPSFTWAVWMSAFLMIYAANEDQVSQDVAIREVSTRSPQMTADRAIEVLKHLDLRGSMWPNACAAAIRDLRAQLVIRRNRSKHTQTVDGHAVQNRVTGRRAPGTLAQESGDINTTNNGLRLSPDTTNRPHNPQDTGSYANPLRNSQQRPSNKNVNDLRNNGITQSFENNMAPGSLFNPSQPFNNRQNYIPSNYLPGLGNAEANGYAYRVGAQLESELQIQSHEGLEFFYGLDAPFWSEGSGWTGIG